MNDLPTVNNFGQRCEYQVQQQANDCWMYGDYIYVDGRRTGSPFQIGVGRPVTVVWENIPSCMALTIAVSVSANDRPTKPFIVNITGRVTDGSNAPCAQYDDLELGANDSTTVLLNTGPLDTPCRYLVEETTPSGWTVDGPSRIEFMPLGADKIKTTQFVNKFTGSPAITASSTSTPPRTTASTKPVQRTTAPPPPETTRPTEPPVETTEAAAPVPVETTGSEQAVTTAPSVSAPPVSTAATVVATMPESSTTTSAALVTTTSLPPMTTRDEAVAETPPDPSSSIDGGLLALGSAAAAALLASFLFAWRRRGHDEDDELYDDML
ncbi:MAG: hypothetical protein H6512_04275 [Acidimicrobiia bacterium]|nr:hypothetical protein [Acidimicrobiia bacterium]